MNTVNQDNFNQTMDGYVEYALDFIKNVLLEKELVDEDTIYDIRTTFIQGLRWAKDEMTMEDARNYSKR